MNDRGLSIFDEEAGDEQAQAAKAANAARDAADDAMGDDEPTRVIKAVDPGPLARRRADATHGLHLVRGSGPSHRGARPRHPRANPPPLGPHRPGLPPPGQQFRPRRW